jgi:RNase P subunit RPR2
VNIQWSRTDQRWYLGVHCRECRSPILFAVDHSDGVESQQAPAGMLVLTCTVEGCKHRADYTDAVVLRLQKSSPIINETMETVTSGKNRNPKG